MKSKTKKYWILGITTLFLLIISFFILIHFPQLFIKKHFSYKSFHLYSNTDISPNESIGKCLDSVDLILKKSAFYQKDQEHHLHFVKGTFYEKMIRLIGRKNMAFAIPGDHQIYSAFPDFKKGIIHRNNNEIEVMNMLQVFSHEAVHNQMRLQYSQFGRPTTPYWINEGYCEYVAYSPFRKQEDYQLKDLVLLLESTDEYWLLTEYDMFSPRDYILYRAIMEFLIDIKGMSVHEIITDEEIEPQRIYEEMKVYFEM